MSKSNLKPCPFCESIICILRACGNSCYWACNSCSGDGPLADTMEEATIKWNTRPAENPVNPVTLSLEGYRQGVIDSKQVINEILDKSISLYTKHLEKLNK